MIDPRSLHIPTSFETDRLSVRAVRATDAPGLLASVIEARPSLRRFPASFPWAVEDVTHETLERYCRECEQRFGARELFAFLVFLKEGEHVGNCALHHVDWSVPKCEVGYWQRPSLCGKGLMSEAIAGVTAFAFERLRMRRVEALPEPTNEASCRLCERIGYALEGTLRNHKAAPDGTVADTKVYAAVR
jgi:RimJ/RimL family protein N-acetyltransferase